MRSWSRRRCRRTTTSLGAPSRRASTCSSKNLPPCAARRWRSSASWPRSAGVSSCRATFCSLRCASGKIAHLHLSWLDPHKIRRITVVGRDKMAVFDDMELERKVTVYDKAPEEPTTRYGEWKTRTGDIYTPKIPTTEPLRLECEQFLRFVRGEGNPMRAAQDGLVVVRALEQLQASLETVVA